MTITIESEGIALTMMPERGAKITSLVDVEARREWLEPPAGPLVGSVVAGQSFDAGDMCGWDEMTPTVAASSYPGSDVVLADHGDLWTTSWEVTSLGSDTVTTRACGDVLPFCLQRSLTLRARSLHVEYTLSTSGDDVLVLWAAHPLFAMHTGTRLVLDGSIEDVTRIGDDGERTIERWPGDGVDVTNWVSIGSGVKLFAQPTGETVSTTLRDPDDVSLTMRWQSADVGHVGLWLDNCSLSRHPVVSIEPTSGCDDALDVAVALGTGWAISHGRDRTWSLEVELSGPGVR
jgi:hypothetical protein